MTLSTSTLRGLPLALLLAGLPLAALADERIDRLHPLDPDASVTIENVRGSITVRTAERADAHILATLGAGVRGLEVEGNRRRLKIKVDYPDSGGWNLFGGAAAGDSQLDITLPPGVALEVSAVSAEIDVDGVRGARAELQSVSGGVRYRGSAAELSLETVSGDARLEGSARELSVQSVSGDVDAEVAVAERLRAESVSGDLDLRVAGPLREARANVVSGDITLRAALAPGGRINAQSLSGDLEVTLPKATSARLDLTSFSGRIRSDAGEVEREEYGPGSSLKASVGQGDGQVRLETFSGDLSLRFE